MMRWRGIEFSSKGGDWTYESDLDGAAEAGFGGRHFFSESFGEVDGVKKIVVLVFRMIRAR